MASTKKQGFVITRAASLTEYFTSTSAYDRSQWVPLSEATVYISPEIAQQAAKKLWMNGLFAAKVQSLSELLDIEMDMGHKNPMNKDDQESEMIAAKQGDPALDDEIEGVCPECSCEPCECDDAALVDGEPIDQIPTDEPSLPDQLPSREPAAEHEEDSMLGQHLKRTAGMESEETARLHPEELKMLGKKRMDMKEGFNIGDVVIPNIGPHKGDRHKVIHIFDDGSMNIQPLHTATIKYQLGAARARPNQVKLATSPLGETEFKIPTRPGNDPATPSENKDTIPNLKAPYDSKQIDFKDPVGTEDKPETDLCYAVAHEHDEKVTVPTELKTQLKAVVDEFNKAANDNNERDDTKGSFAMTVASALQQLLDDLELGTVAGIKQAQIHISSYMNPITSHIPEDVLKYIARGGRKSSLKNLFNVKWEKMRRAE